MAGERHGMAGEQMGAAWHMLISLYSAPWKEPIRNSEIKAITGVSLLNSQSNEIHLEISFASHLNLERNIVNYKII
jgi:hypothetical protein